MIQAIRASTSRKPAGLLPWTRGSLLLLAGLMVACAGLSGCATMPIPRNRVGAQYQGTQAILDPRFAAVCAFPPPPSAIDGLHPRGLDNLVDAPDVLGAGDRLHLLVSGDKDVLSHDYVIEANGRMTIDGRLGIAAAGRSRDSVEAELRQRLVMAGMVRDIAGNVRLSTVETAAVAVSVEGAVFQPGIIDVGQRANENHNTTVVNAAFGDFNTARTLTAALQDAGGIRPDAALATVYLLRGGAYTQIDLRPALGDAAGGSGIPVNPQVARGDRIIIPSLGCFRPELMRPSPVTAPGIRVFMSNLSRPASNNASAAIGKDSTSLPYGTRLLQALVAANCVGGSNLNAQRSAVLISRNPINGRSVVISREIETLVRDSDRDDHDPYLMPGDSLACYDSKAMTLVDAVGVVGNALTPLALYKSIHP